MTGLTPQIASEILNACQLGAAEAAEAIGRALDQPIVQVTPRQADSVDLRTLPPECDGPGLAIVLNVGTSAAVFLLPKLTGLVPDWCDQPDATGRSKLTTLAQELGMILLPETCMPEDFKAGVIQKLTGGVARGQLMEGAQRIALDLETADQRTGTAYLVWPLAQGSAVLGAASARVSPPPAAPTPGPTAPAATEPRPASGTAGQSTGIRLKRPAQPAHLPAFTKSMLKVQVPVSVTLVRQKQAIQKILSIGPGAIIQFDKSCEDMLDLEIGDLRIGSGEAVKVGEKFGLRINAIALPKERFRGVRFTSPSRAKS